MDLLIKKKRTIWSSIFSLVDKVLRVIIGIFVGVWLARYLGKSDFGDLNFSLSIVAITSVLTSGFGPLIVKEFMHSNDNESTFLSSALLLQFIYGMISFIIPCLAVYFFYKFEDYEVYKFIVILSIPNVLKFTDIFRSFFESKFLTFEIVAIEFIIFLLITVIRIFFIVNEFQNIYFIFLISIESITLSIIWAFKFFRVYKTPISLTINASYLLNLFNLSFPIILSGIGIIIYMRLDIIMIKYFMGSDKVGLYSAALRISEGIYFIPMALLSAINPLLLNFYKDKLQYHLLYKNILILLNFISLSFCLFFSFTSDFFIQILYGKDFFGAGEILVIHIWTTIFVFLGIPLSSYLIFDHNSKILFYKTFIGLCINIILNFVLIPLYGLKGAAYATLITQVLISFVLNLAFKSCRAFFYIQLSSFDLRNFPRAFLFFKKNIFASKLNK